MVSIKSGATPTARRLLALAEGRTHGVAGAGIDQRPSSRELQQERVHRDWHVVFPAREPFGLGLVHAEHDIERRGEHAVAQRRDRDVVDPLLLLGMEPSPPPRSWLR